MEAKDIKKVRDIQLFVSKMYPNDDRDFSYIFSYTSRHVGYLGKSLNQKRPSVDEFVRTVSWIFALANKLNIDIEDSLIERHPGICPYCVTTPCKCLETNKKPYISIKAYNIPQELTDQASVLKRLGNFTLADHAKRLADIYPGNAYIWRFSGPWMHTSKMQEELAEVHEAATRFFSQRKNLNAVAEEFSDLLAWILSAWRISFPDEAIDEQFISFYLNGCPVCGKKTCDCMLYSDSSSQLVEPRIIEELGILFLKLAKEVGTSDFDIKEIQKSLSTAAATQSEPVARTALLEVKNKTTEIERLVERGAGNAKNIATIIESIRKFFESFPFL